MIFEKLFKFVIDTLVQVIGQIDSCFDLSSIRSKKVIEGIHKYKLYGQTIKN